MRGLGSPRLQGGQSIRSLITPLVVRQRGRLIRMSVAAIAGGFAEAAILVLIARIAFALASSGSDVKVNLGPLGQTTVSIDALIVTTAVLVVLRVVLQTIVMILESRVPAAVAEEQRERLIHLYLG